MVAKQNLVIYQGSDLRKVLEFRDESSVLMDLTGCTLKGQGRSSYGASSVAFNITLTVRDQLTDLGVVDFHIPASETASLPITKETNFIYDIEMTTLDGDVKRIMEGNAKVYPEVTK